MMTAFIMLIHNCVRLDDPAVKSCFLIPNLWQHIYRFTQARHDKDPKHMFAFLSFIHMHAFVLDGPRRGVTIDKFPELDRTFQDIVFLNQLWHAAEKPERQILGDYLAATGGAAVHAALLGDLVADANSIMSDGNMQKAEPLLANMNNLALPSSVFAEEMCGWGVLEHLNAILTSNGPDLTTLKDSVSKTITLRLSIAEKNIFLEIMITLALLPNILPS